MSSVLVSVIVFAVVLALLIGFHEMAHLTVAKLFGVKVIRFSLGFGPVLAKFKLGETEYVLSLLPLGGYVKPLSEDLPAEERGSEPPERYFESKPAWQRFLVFLAGPSVNLFLTFVLLVGLFYWVGVPKPTTVLGEVAKGSPAERAGLKAEDKILAVNGEVVDSWEEIVLKIRAGSDREVGLKVARGQELLKFQVKPEKKLLGIMPKAIYESPEAAAAVQLGGKATWNYLALFADFFKKVMKLEAERDSVGGLIMIGQVVGQAAKSGVVSLIEVIIFISLNIFVFNILPIPLLDGGQLYPALFEMITGIKPSKRFFQIWQSMGILLLLVIFLLGFYNDIERILKNRPAP